MLKLKIKGRQVKSVNERQLNIYMLHAFISEQTKNYQFSGLTNRTG